MSKNSTVVIETLDYEKLKLEGGPVTYTKQIGYGLYYLVATVQVFGTAYDQAKITFANSAGPLFPMQGIFLNPQHTTETGDVLSSGLMTLTVSYITLVPPTPDTPGSVSIQASWTDLNGSGKSQFTGPIAGWTNPPSQS